MAEVLQQSELDLLHQTRYPFELLPLARTFMSKFLPLPEDLNQRQKDQQIIDWVQSFHDKAVQVFHYPCLRRYGFVTPQIQDHPLYSAHIQQRKDIVTVLDVGCCMGTDLRYLTAIEGINPLQLRGIELLSEFLRLGNEFFQDGEENQRMFVAGDLLAPDFFSSSAFRHLQTVGTSSSFPSSGATESFDVVVTNRVLHLFSRSDQVKLMEVVQKLLKPGGFWIGLTTGLPSSEELPNGILLHDPYSLKTLLTEAFHSKQEEEQPLYVDTKEWHFVPQTAAEIAYSSHIKRIFIFFGVQKSFL